ncbi:unnamed protein product [Boreogadus saida]
MRLLRLKPSYRTSNQLRVYQPRPLRLRNPLIQRMTCCLQLRPVASLQRRKSKHPLPLRRSLKGLLAARLEDLGEWSPLGPQVAETQDGQGVWAVPSGPQTLEREGIPDFTYLRLWRRTPPFPAGVQYGSAGLSEASGMPSRDWST